MNILKQDQTRIEQAQTIFGSSRRMADDYLKLTQHSEPIKDVLSNFHFEICGNTEDTSAAASNYAELVVAFNEYIKGIRALSDWRMVPGIPEDEVDWAAIDEEIRHITGQYGYFSSEDEARLKYFVKEK